MSRPPPSPDAAGSTSGNNAILGLGILFQKQCLYKCVFLFFFHSLIFFYVNRSILYLCLVIIFLRMAGMCLVCPVLKCDNTLCSEVFLEPWPYAKHRFRIGALGIPQNALQPPVNSLGPCGHLPYRQEVEEGSQAVEEGRSGTTSTTLGTHTLPPGTVVPAFHLQTACYAGVKAQFSCWQGRVWVCFLTG